jgi:hypothetical protein
MKHARYLLQLAMVSSSFLPGNGLERGAEPNKIAMTAEHWNTTGAVEFLQHNGLDAIELKAGNRETQTKTGEARPSGILFRNGTLEFDIEPKGAMGAGIIFRQVQKNSGYFYLRPRPNCAEAPDCIQYAPQTHGVLLWDMFPQYQAPAPLRENQWNHIKMVISGQRMNVYINGKDSESSSPTLKVGSLEGDTLEGELQLEGPGFFANFSVTPEVVEGLPSKPEKDATESDRRYLRQWQLSPYAPLAADQEATATDLPAASAAWISLTAERNGLLNISRQYGGPLPAPQFAVAWLKTSIRSDKRQAKKVSIGWSRVVWVFVNGKQVFADKNLYQPPTARKTPDGRCSLENGSFSLPLNKGNNEVTMAVANNFYGWGVILRLDDLDGIHLGQK